ncbi:hypothetical protein ACOXXX_18395 [Thalassococcus sp. BH17M4-6]|uniref:hypothetical protein n=1 Tax=Thalassococcus sp. BH17M4-6 TaxID=3413148 RepID=UPI003BC8D485
MPVPPLFRPVGLALALLLSATPAMAQDETINGDLDLNGSLHTRDNSVIQGYLCLGDSCATTAAAQSFDVNYPLKFSYSRVAIEFDDQSVSTHPSHHWGLLVNDAESYSAGGIDRFSVHDFDSDRTPFTILPGAPDNSFWLNSAGRLGLGTAMPLADLHLVGGSTARLRMQSTGSLAGNWEVLSNSLNWFLQNIDGKEVPVVVRAGAKNGSLYIADNSAIGMGTDSPAAALHVQKNDGSASLLVENLIGSPPAAREMFAMRNNGGSYFTLDNTRSRTTWFFTHEDAAPNRFIIADAVADGPEMTLTAGGDLTIQGQLFTRGSCAAGCDRVFDEDYPLPTIAEQAAMMRANKHLPAVGPTPENGPFNITAMTGGMLNELEKAHLYIAELEGRVARLEALVSALSGK